MTHTCWNDFTKQTLLMPSSSTLHGLRNPTKYWVVTDAQLKRDLKPRTLRQIYAENKSGREHRPAGRDYNTDKAKYLAWCRAKRHTPHPGSIDPDHPINAYRLKMPRMVKETPAPVVEYRMAA